MTHRPNAKAHSFALSLQTMTRPAAGMSTEGFVTLLRVKRKRNDALQQAFGAHADCPLTLSPAMQWSTLLSMANSTLNLKIEHWKVWC